MYTIYIISEFTERIPRGLLLLRMKRLKVLHGEYEYWYYWGGQNGISSEDIQ